MKKVPTDDKTLDEMYNIISSEEALPVHIANARQPNSADPHKTDIVVERFGKNVKSYVERVVSAGRRFRTDDS